MNDFGLQVQRLGRGTDRVLVVSEFAGAQHGDGWFTPKAVQDAFEAFRLPPPSNVSQALAQLRQKGFVRRRESGGLWSLTPLGRREVVTLMGEVDASSAEVALLTPTGAEFGHAVHALIPPAFAPVKWSNGIAHFLKRFEFDRNVFCMTRFPIADHELDPLEDVITTIRAALERHSLTLHLASDRNIDDDLWGNVAAHGWACKYGIALFEDRIGRGLNHNLVAEVGAMLMTGRRCALLKDESQESMPTDFVGQIYKSVDFGDLNEVANQVEAWVTQDLGLGG
jgi:hypothetical protein